MRRLLILLTLLLSACAMPKADAAREAQALQVYRWIRDGDLAQLQAASTPATAAVLTEASLAPVRSYTRPGAPRSVKTLHWSFNTVVGGQQSYELIQQLDYPDDVVILRSAFVKEPSGPWLLHGVNVNTVDQAQIASSGFQLAGKSPGHYAMLVAVVVFPLLCLSAVAVAGWRRRWGWMVGSLFGFGQFSLDWTTGQWGLQPIYFQLLAAGAFKGLGPLDPWILSVALPIPAVLFWGLKRYRPKPTKVKKANPAATETPPSDAPEL